MAAELDRQLDLLVALGYPRLAGTAEERLRARAEELRRLLDGRAERFALVVPCVDAEAALPLVRQGENVGYVDMRPVRPAEFAPLDGLDVPAEPYLLVDPDTGRDTLGVAPRDALPRIEARGRSPLTIAEGIALATVFPGILRAESCFQMLASRRADKRIPSLWVAKDGRPRLGWCFEGVPHGWLGAASCAARLA